MTFIFLRVQLSCLLAFLPMIPSMSLAQERVSNLSVDTVASIVETYDRRAFDDFNHFVFTVYSKSPTLFNQEQHKALGDFLTNKPVDPQRRFIIHRLLGVYSRLKYGGEARRLLQQFMLLPIYENDGVKPVRPEYRKFEKLLLKTAKQFKLKTQKQDGGVQISLLGKGRFRGETLRVASRIDVPQIDHDLWVGQDGLKSIEPLQLTQLENSWYGHGLRRKSALVLSLFAMRVIKEEKLKQFNRLTLSVGSNAESASIKPKHSQIVLEGSCGVEPGRQIVGQATRWSTVLREITNEYAATNANRRLTRFNPDCLELALSSGVSGRESKSIDVFLSDLQFLSETFLHLQQLKGLQ